MDSSSNSRRVYSPETGRFLSPDPLIQAPEYSQSFNRYSYVWNNPLNNIDPSGYALVNIWDPSGIKDKDGKRSEKCNHPDPRRCGNYFKFLSQMRLKRLMQAQQKARQACAKGLGPACKAALAELDAAGGLMPEGVGDDIGSCEIPKQCAENPDLGAGDTNNQTDQPQWGDTRTVNGQQQIYRFDRWNDRVDQDYGKIFSDYNSNFTISNGSGWLAVGLIYGQWTVSALGLSVQYGIGLGHTGMTDFTNQQSLIYTPSEIIEIQRRNQELVDRLRNESGGLGE